MLINRAVASLQSCISVAAAAPDRAEPPSEVKLDDSSGCQCSRISKNLER